MTKMMPKGEQVHPFDIHQPLSGLVDLTKLINRMKTRSIHLVNFLSPQEAIFEIQTLLQERRTLKCTSAKKDEVAKGSGQKC